MAEGVGLLNRFRVKTLTRVRIPPSPLSLSPVISVVRDHGHLHFGDGPGGTGGSAICSALSRQEIGHISMQFADGCWVAIARAFANDPAIILADKPTGNLDLSTGTHIISVLHDMNKERGVTVIRATHDHKMLAVSDRISV